MGEMVLSGVLRASKQMKATNKLALKLKAKNKMAADNKNTNFFTFVQRTIN